MLPRAPRKTLVCALVLASLATLSAQRRPDPAAVAPVDRYLAPAFPFELVSAARADRIAWLAYERGRRNVYTAAAP